MLAAFVDLEKAYAKLWRADLWRALRKYGIGGGLLEAIKVLYKESKACVRVEAELTEEFVVKQRLRQGCPLSPWLFLYCLGQSCEGGYGRVQRGSDVRQLPHTDLAVCG